MPGKIHLSKALIAALLFSCLLIYQNCTTPTSTAVPDAEFSISPGSLVLINQEVTLDAAPSSNPDGGPIVIYFWRFRVEGKPQGSEAFLSPTNESICKFTPDLPGFYWVSLTVTDEENENGTVVKPIEAIDQISNAGSDQLADVGETVFLDGSGTLGLSGITYEWRIISKPVRSALTSTSINNRTSILANFQVDEPGVYQIILEVIAGTNHDADIMQVITRPPEISDVQPDTGMAGTVVTISGKNFSSDLAGGGNAVKFNGVTATLMSAASDELQAAVPGGASSGPITVTLAETGEVASAADDFIVLGPVADAGRDTVLNFPIDPTLSYTLDGSASYDPLGRELRYIWSVAQSPPLASPALGGGYNQPSGSFQAAEPGSYLIELRVYVEESQDETDRDTMMITSLPPEIISFTPDSAAVGDLINIIGWNLSLDVTGNALYFNDVQAQAQGPNSTSDGLIWKVPAGATTGPIKVVVLETGESYSTTSDFKVGPGPASN